MSVNKCLIANSQSDTNASQAGLNLQTQGASLTDCLGVGQTWEHVVDDWDGGEFADREREDIEKLRAEGHLAFDCICICQQQQELEVRIGVA